MLLCCPDSPLKGRLKTYVKALISCYPDSPLKGRLKTYVKALISAIDIKSIQIMEAKVEREKEKRNKSPVISCLDQY